MHCNLLQHTTTHCNTLKYICLYRQRWRMIWTKSIITHCNKLQHNATHWNLLKHTATHCSTLQGTATHLIVYVYTDNVGEWLEKNHIILHTCNHLYVLQFIAVCCSVLQRVVACCSVLQYVAVCCCVVRYVVVCCGVLRCDAVCRSENDFSQITSYSIHATTCICCSVLQCVAACCSVL